MDAALRRIWGDLITGSIVEEAAERASQAVATPATPGGPMHAACKGLEPPSKAHLRLFWAATTLRECRGDAHIGVLRSNGLDGAAANRLMLAAGLVPPDQQLLRGWSDDHWSRATRTLRQRGALEGRDRITRRGRQLIEANERSTDDLADQPLLGLGHHGLDRLDACLERLVPPILATGLLSFPNPMALPQVHEGHRHGGRGT